MTVDYKALAAQAAKTSDQSQDTSTVFEYTLPAEGQTGIRFVEYIELGFQPQKPFQGKAKPPAMEALYSYDLLGPKYIHEIEVEGGGKKVTCDQITERVTVKLSEKANFRKLFERMVYGRPDIAHSAQMLGDAFLGHVTHSPATNDKGEKIKQYANLRKPDGSIGIGAPRVEVPIMVDGLPTGEVNIVPLPVKDAIRPVRIFLFDHPSPETWQSLFIDGFTEIKNEKGEVTGKRSKNWIQEKILSSTKFKGSALEAMLHGLGGLSIQPGVEPAQDEGAPFEEDAPSSAGNTPPAAAAAQAAQSQAPKSSATDDAQAALAALGLADAA